MGTPDLGWLLDTWPPERDTANAGKQCYVNMLAYWRGPAKMHVSDTPYAFDVSYYEGQWISLQEDGVCGCSSRRQSVCDTHRTIRNGILT